MQLKTAAAWTSEH